MGKRWKEELWEEAVRQAQDAHRQLNQRTLFQAVADSGVQLIFTHEPHQMGPLRWRALLDRNARTLKVYERAVQELQTEHARELILAHEVFHLLQPACPESVAELAAHLFASEHVKSKIFAPLIGISR